MQFAPTYHDYVLYSDGSEVAPKRYRARTFVPTGQEMESVRKPKNPYFDKLDDTGFSPENSTGEVLGPMTSDSRNKGSRSGGIADLMGGPLINEAELRQAYDMSPVEPAVIAHQIVDIELPPGTVRPAQ